VITPIAPILVPKINVTRDYRLFCYSLENRERCLSKHRKLRRSIEKYGTLPYFPAVCRRDKDKNLIVIEGQHRIAFAEEKGLPVYWVETDINFDVAEINCTPVGWAPVDYANRYAREGLSDYREALAFADVNNIPITSAFTLLSGAASYGAISEALKGGTFTIKAAAWAYRVIDIYNAFAKMDRRCCKSCFLLALMMVCRVSEFDERRLIRCAERCQEKLASYSTKEAFLAMLEEIYNHKQQKLFGLKTEAHMAARNQKTTTK